MSEQRERYWRGVLERWAVSGTTVVAFCEREGVSTASFYTWRKRLAGQDAAAGRLESASGVEDEVAHSGPVFLPVRVNGRPDEDASVASDASPKAAVEVMLPDGIVVRVADGAARETIVDVLAALGVEP